MSLDQTSAEMSKPAQAAPSQAKTRAEVNRANAQHSTGPKSIAGKLRSSQNSFQHGLYSKQLIVPGEDPAEFDHLRATLRNEHQPADTTEEILVDELAQHFWRMRRFRELEARAWQPENLADWCDNGMMALIQRGMASAERSFHKSLTALRALQKVRGFVPPKTEPAPSHIKIIEIEDHDPADETASNSGFVPQIHDPAETQLGPNPHRSFSRYFENPEDHDAELGFVPSNSIDALLQTDQELDFEPLAA